MKRKTKFELQGKYKNEIRKTYQYKTFDRFNYRNAGITYYLTFFYIDVTVVKQKCGISKPTYPKGDIVIRFFLVILESGQSF